MRRSTDNRTLAAALLVVIAGMTGLAFAAVPLYRVFCAATGYGGTPQIGAAVSPGETARTIRVRFNADTNPGLPWRFAPAQPSVVVRLGEERLAFYTAENAADGPVTGVATYNVTPDTVGRYFHKTACFCFNQQTLAAGQHMEFPLSFCVGPRQP
jgi:cytochrome c oxidase assembly protein subunit 11